MKVSELPLWKFLLGVVLIAGLSVWNLVLYITSDAPFYGFVLGMALLGFIFYQRQQGSK